MIYKTNRNINLIGWCGNILFFLGAILLSNKNEFGFLANIFANGCYIIQGSLLHVSSLIWVSLILVVINAYGLILWLF